MNRVINATLVIVALCACVVTGLLVRRTLFPAHSVPRSQARAELSASEREALRGVSSAAGPATATTELIEFTDLQCPFCAGAHDTVEALLARHPETLRLRVVHTPLTGIHPAAFAAAVAATCAERQGRLLPFMAAVYAHQRTLEAATLDSLAGPAGITDLASFAACRRESSTLARVDSSLRMANSIGIDGTPTFYLDGLLIPVGIPPGGLAQRVEARMRDR